MKRIENLDFGRTRINKVVNKEDKNMNSVKNQVGRSSFDWRHLTFAFLVALTGFASVAQTTYWVL